MPDEIAANEALRLKRLVFYAEDQQRIDAALQGFLRKAGATSVAVVDTEGHLVARQGIKAKGDPASLAALVAGAFAGLRQVARLVGEADFRTMSHAGQDQAIHMTLIGPRTLQVAVFPASVKAGMVAMFSGELAQQLAAILTDAEKRSQDAPPQLDQGFSQAAKSQLDDLFGNL
jgi:predicted regulator of Ras-like GTPase activity (Roadblock/LC7/MglB family)